MHIKMDNANKDERRIPIEVWKSSGKKEGAAKKSRSETPCAESRVLPETRPRQRWRAGEGGLTTKKTQ